MLFLITLFIQSKIKLFELLLKERTILNLFFLCLLNLLPIVFVWIFTQ